MDMQEVLISSSLDGTLQSSLVYRAEGAKRPLIVGLHTWSFDRFNQVDNLLPIAQEYNFHLILPEFRGPNLVSNPLRTQACASPLAIQDIRDAVDYAIREMDADPAHVFLFGGSGGGHMALMMAGVSPEMFEAIAAFVPITDLRKWVGENPNYTEHILACCSADEEEMYRRSPVAYLDGIARANVKIFHGKYDHSVPVTHSTELFRLINERHPHSRVFLDVFDGGHDFDFQQAMYWFMSQYKKSAGSSVSS